jgi:hypothetical protein
VSLSEGFAGPAAALPLALGAILIAVGHCIVQGGVVIISDVLVSGSVKGLWFVR